MDRSVEGANGVMGAALRTEAVRAVTEVLLVDRLQHVAHGTLDKLVLERRDPNRPFPAPVLGDVHTSDRLVSIPLRLQPLVQVLEVLRQVLPVVLLRDTVYPHRRVLTDTPIGSLQRGHIDQMRQ